jgi:hypothetical protein
MKRHFLLSCLLLSLGGAVACDEPDLGHTDSGVPGPTPDAAPGPTPDPTPGPTPVPPSPAFAGSCIMATSSSQFCVDYNGSGYTVSGIQATCAALSATYSSGHRDSSYLSGSCASTNAAQGLHRETVTYHYPRTTLEAAMGACANAGGTFTRGTVAFCTGSIGEWREDGQLSSGEPVGHGQSEPRWRFEASSVTVPASCVGEWQYRMCTNGEWSSWSGTYSETSCEERRVCTGTPVQCSTREDSWSCQNQRGCDWISSGGARCAGTPPSCSSRSTWDDCTDVLGCSWN